MAILVTDKENLGKISRTPDEGWRRIDSSHEYIMPYGDNYVSIENVNAVEHWENKAINFLRGYVGGANFAFYGTKLKFVGPAYDGWGNPHTVIIDGEKYKLYCNAGSNPSGVVNFTTHFEITGLKNRIHKVELIVDGEPTNTGYQSKYKFDCIDIDADGYMCPSLVTNYEFPVKVGNAEDVESFAGTLVSGEEQLLITREGGLFITDGMGGYTQCGGSGSNDAKDIVFDNSNTEIVSDNVQDALKEVFQYASNGKALVSEAVAGKGFTADTNMTFKELADRVSAIPTAPATFNGSTEIEATLGEDNLKAGDIVKLINNNTLITKINNESNPNIAPECYTNHSCFSEDGTLFAAPSTGGKNIRIYEVDESGMFKQLCVITPSVTTVNSYVSFSSDNKYLLATLTSNIVLFKRVGDTFEEVFKLTGSSSYTYVEAQFMYDNYFVYSYRGDTSIYKIDSSNDSVALVHKLDDTTAFIKLRYNKNLNIIYGYTSNNVRAIQLTKSGDDFTSEQIFLASHSNVKNIDVSPSGEYIVIASTTGTLIYKYTGTSYLRVEAALVSVTLPSYAVGVSWINNNTFIVAGTGFILGVNRNGDQFSADLQAADETFVGYGLSTSALINKFLVVNTRTGVEIYKVNINKGVAAYKVTDTSYFKNCEGLGMLTVDGDAGDVRIINKFLERNSELLYTKDEVDAIIYKEIKTALEILGIDDNDLLSTVPLTF